MHRSKSIILLFLLAVVLILPGLANREFYTRGEPREALVAQSMLETGSWLVGVGYGEGVPSKPPLTHWLSTAAASIFGEVTAFTSRLPSALCSILAVVGFAAFIAIRFGVERGFATGFVLLTSVEWLRSSVTARVDMTFAAALLAALLMMFLWLESGRKRMPLLAVVFLALAVLAKGPVALVLVGGVLVVWLSLTRASVAVVAFSLVRLLVPAAALAGLWYYAAFLEQGESFVGKFWYENGERFFDLQEDEPHRSSALSLWLSLLMGLAPWTIVALPALLSECTSGRKWKLRERFHSINSWWHSRSKFEQFSWLTLVTILVFFSIPGSKRSVYLLPAYPFAAFLLTGLLPQLRSTAQRDKSFFFRGLVHFAGILTLCSALFVVLVALNKISPAEWFLVDSKPWQFVSFHTHNFEMLFVSLEPIDAVFLSGVLLLSLVMAVRGSLTSSGVPFSEIRSVAIWWASLVFAVNAVLFPVLVNRLSSKAFASQLSSLVAPRDKLFSFGTEFYGISFYMKRPVYRFEVSKPSEGVAVLNEHDLDWFKEEVSGLEVIARAETPITHPHYHVVLVKFW